MKDDTLPRDHRLCYHTQRLDHLVSALKDGLWPRYCPEDYSNLFGDHIGEQFWLASPMVCFTDMLPDTNELHRGRYGKYTIALAKDAASTLGINPLIYVLADSYVAEQIVNSLRPGRAGRLVKTSALWPLLPFIKVTPGAQLSRGGGGRHDSWEIIPMEDEMEWRYVPSELALKTVEGVRESKDIDPALVALSEVHRLPIPRELITDIIVPTKADAKTIMDRFPDLQGKVVVRRKRGWLRRALAWLDKGLP